jgi:FdhD protein
MSRVQEAFHSVPARRIDYGTSAETVVQDVAVEVPVNLIYGGLPHVVLMATPADLEDLALGFSLTEGIITTRKEMRGCRVEDEARGLLLHIELAGEALSRLLARRRAMAGRTGCGICGVESLDQLTLAARVEAAPAITGPAIAAALGALAQRQPLHTATHGVHGAGWFSLAGAPLLVREDVGRHNALDKMIGAAQRMDLSPQEGFAVITSRCSFEMVEKVAVFGASTLVAISAPTSLAIERAAALGVRLVCVARGDAALEFGGGNSSGGGSGNSSGGGGGKS